MMRELADNILESDMVKTNLTQGEVASLLMNCFTYMDYEQQQLQVPADDAYKSKYIKRQSALVPDIEKNKKNIYNFIYG